MIARKAPANHIVGANAVRLSCGNREPRVADRASGVLEALSDGGLHHRLYARGLSYCLATVPAPTGPFKHELIDPKPQLGFESCQRDVGRCPILFDTVGDILGDGKCYCEAAASCASSR